LNAGTIRLGNKAFILGFKKKKQSTVTINID